MQSSFTQRARRAALVGAAFVLTACATPYGQKGLTGGYTDVQIEPHIYKVTFDGNGKTSSDTVFNYWLYRCAELTKEKGYTFFGLFRARTSTLDGAEEHQAMQRRAAVYRPGQDDAERLDTRAVRGAPTYIYVPSYGGGQITTWHKTDTIVMYHTRAGAMTPEHAYALHAQTVLDMLKPFVDSEGKTPAPERKAIIDAAAHLQPVPAGSRTP